MSLDKSFLDNFITGYNTLGLGHGLSLAIDFAKSLTILIKLEINDADCNTADPDITDLYLWKIINETL